MTTSKMQSWVLMMMVVTTMMLFICTRPSFAFFDEGPVACISPVAPCRIKVEIKMNNGSEVETSSVQTCSCSGGVTCSSDWTKEGHVINRKVVSYTSNITLQMMFCRSIEPARFCNRRDIALIMTGSLIMPTDVSSYNCRCRRRKPLLLHERGWGVDHQIYQKYVCANHKRMCSSSDPCMAIRVQKTSYECKCPQNHSCRAEPYYPTNNVTYGYCISNSNQPTVV